MLMQGGVRSGERRSPVFSLTEETVGIVERKGKDPEPLTPLLRHVVAQTFDAVLRDLFELCFVDRGQVTW